MAEKKGIEYLRMKLATKQARVNTRYKFYEMKNYVLDLGISTPPTLRNFNAVVGWCAKAVDSLSDRLTVSGFKSDTFGLETIYRMNNADVLFDSAILGALISSCDFLYISADETGFPRIQVIDGSKATGIMDPISGMLTEGYAILESDHGVTKKEAYFEPGMTTFYTKGDPDPLEISNDALYPLLVPIIFRPDAKRPFGHSRISRACMSYSGSAARTIKRSEIAAEFFSFPQKYVLGTSPDAEALDKWQASMSSLIEFTRDEDGQVPTLGQFAQQSMQPHSDQLRMFASLFAGETGLTLDDLGFVSDNPSSSEAIRAAHENLRLTARKAQRTFKAGFLHAGLLAASIRDKRAYNRQQIYLTEMTWDPIFEPDATTMSLIGDGAIKVNQAIPGYFGMDNLQELIGIKPSGK